MRNPKEEEYVRCPDARSTRTYKPDKVFDNGTQGILGSHGHGWKTPDCPYTGLPTVIRPHYRKVDEPTPSASWDDDEWETYYYKWYGWGI